MVEPLTLLEPVFDSFLGVMAQYVEVKVKWIYSSDII